VPKKLLFSTLSVCTCKQTLREINTLADPRNVTTAGAIWRHIKIPPHYCTSGTRHL